MKALFTITSWCYFQVLFALPIDSTKFYFERGVEAQKEKRMLFAYQQFQKSLSFNTENKETILAQAFVAKEIHKPDQAQLLFEKAYKMDPSNLLVVEELSNLYFNFHKYNKAIELAQKCKDCSSSARIIGLCNYELEDYVTAEKYLKLSLNQSPTDLQVLYTLAKTYVSMEQYKNAMTYYSQIVKMQDVKPLWIYEQGILYYENSDYKNALTAFNNALAHGYEPGNDFNENLAFTLVYCNEYDKAENMIMDLWKKNPGKKDIVKDLIAALYDKKQYDRALFYCERLMEIDPKDSKTLFQAGLCFQKKGQKEKGDNLCDKAIELDPSLQSLRTKREISAL